jgi:hypothetical protein
MMNFESRPLIDLEKTELFDYIIDLEREVRRYRTLCHKHRVHIHQLESRLMIERANRGRA